MIAFCEQRLIACKISYKMKHREPLNSAYNSIYFSFQFQILTMAFNKSIVIIVALATLMNVDAATLYSNKTSKGKFN